MICTHCNVENREEARFCRGCGQPLPASGVTTPTAVSPLEQRLQEAEEVQMAPPPSEVAPEHNTDSDAATRDVALPAKASSAPAVAVLLPGTTLQAGRYEMLRLLASNGDVVHYEVHDRQRCPQCQAEVTPDGSPFCEQCGASLEGQRALRRLRQTANPPDEAQIADALDAFEEMGLHYQLLRLAEEATTKEESRGARLAVGLASDIGRVRELDEDSVLALTFATLVEGRAGPSLGFYAVADGIGGLEGGEVASKAVLNVLGEWVTQRILLPEMGGEPLPQERMEAVLCEGVQFANERLFVLRQRKESNMGATLTAALLRDGQATVLNVGDSRTYLWHGGQLEQITTDHSLVAKLIADGKAAPEEMYNHPQKGVIYRSMGDKPEVEIDLFTCSPAPGDRLVLCCDGVWEMLHPEGIEEVLLTYTDPQYAAAEMVKRANLAGGEDNISVVIVGIEAM